MHLKSLIPLLFLLLAAGCSSRPDGVVSHGDMVDIMVDIHRGEAYAESNYQSFNTDSSKMVIRQSILRSHGLTAEQFDSSLMWYGRQTEELSEIYTEVIDRLQADMDNIDATYTASTSFAGDSINAWTESPFYVLSQKSPSSLLKFTLPADENWQRGDSYTWQFKTTNQRGMAITAMFMDYDDGSTEMVYNDFNSDGWQRLTIVADSLKNPVNVYGYTSFTLSPVETIYLDSVSLVRKRLNEEFYRQRYRQRKFEYNKTKTPQNGSSSFARTDFDL